MKRRRCDVNTAKVAVAALSVFSGVAFQDLFPKPDARHAASVMIPQDRRKITRDKNDVLRRSPLSTA